MLFRSFKRLISILLVVGSILYLLIIDFKSIPWVGLAVAFSWSFYNLLRKKISVDTDIGLFIESLFILPFALIAFYIIFKNNFNDFDISNPSLMLLIMLAGPMTVIPLFLYVKGVEYSGLGPTGMIFYITPSFQFILGSGEVIQGWEIGLPLIDENGSIILIIPSGLGYGSSSNNSIPENSVLIFRIKLLKVR